MAELRKPPVLDETAQRMVLALEALAEDIPVINHKSWANASDDAIFKYISMADKGTINLHNDLGWTVGDTRKEKLLDGTEIDLILTDPGHYELVTPLESGKTTCHFTIVARQLYKNTRNMNFTGDSYHWDGNDLDEYLNVSFYGSFNDTFRKSLKKIKVKVASHTAINAEDMAGAGSVVKTVEEYITIPAEGEIYNVCTNGYQSEFEAVSQLDYFKTPTHRVKELPTGVATSYWLRSPLAVYAGSTSRYFPNTALRIDTAGNLATLVDAYDSQSNAKTSYYGVCMIMSI